MGRVVEREQVPCPECGIVQERKVVVRQHGSGQAVTKTAQMRQCPVCGARFGGEL